MIVDYYNSYINVLTSEMANLPSFQRFLHQCAEEHRIVQTVLPTKNIPGTWYPEYGKAFGTLILGYHYRSKKGKAEMELLINERGLGETYTGPVSFHNPPSDEPDYV